MDLIFALLTGGLLIDHPLDLKFEKVATTFVKTQFLWPNLMGLARIYIFTECPPNYGII